MWSTPSRLREPSTDSMICDGTKGPNQTLTLTLMRALALSLALALTLTLTLARILTLALSHLVAGDAGAAAVLAEPREALIVAADLGGDDHAIARLLGRAQPPGPGSGVGLGVGSGTGSGC